MRCRLTLQETHFDYALLPVRDTQLKYLIQLHYTAPEMSNGISPEISTFIAHPPNHNKEPYRHMIYLNLPGKGQGTYLITKQSTHSIDKLPNLYGHKTVPRIHSNHPAHQQGTADDSNRDMTHDNMYGPTEGSNSTTTGPTAKPEFQHIEFPAISDVRVHNGLKNQPT